MLRDAATGTLPLLFALAACGTAEPLPVRMEHRLEEGVWSLQFREETGLLLELRGEIVARAASVRLVRGPDRHDTELRFARVRREGETLVVACAPHPDHAVEIHARLTAGGSLEVRVEDVVGLHDQVAELSLRYELPALAGPEETFVPHLHGGDGEVAGDGSFHVPLAFLRRGRLAVALLPDCEQLARERRLPQCLELDAGGEPRLRHGLACQELRDGGYSRAGSVAVQAETLRFAHTLRVVDGADAGSLDSVVRELWTAADQGPRPPDVPSFDSLCGGFFAQAVDQWLDLSTRDEAAGTFSAGPASGAGVHDADHARYCARHQSLRTAYGLTLHARRTGNAAWLERARQVLAHALTAPTRAGVAPTVFHRDPQTGRRRWLLGSDLAGERYNTTDIASTGYWLLCLSADHPRHRSAVLATCRRTARFLEQNQLPSGGFPSFFSTDYLAPDQELLFAESAETGSAAHFLVQFGIDAADGVALAAARRALVRVQQLAAAGRLFDAESMPPGAAAVDPRSAMPRQGTLGLLHAALATFRLHEHQPDPALLHLGVLLLGHLARYQQTWAPPFVPGARVGGLRAGNFDHHWNDSRQALAAWAFCLGYEHTGDPHWLERGVAALRCAHAVGAAAYSVPDSPEQPAAPIHWGRGLACTVTEILRARLGQAVIDLRAGSAFGLDAVWFEDGIAAAEQRIVLRPVTDAADLAALDVRLRGCPADLPRLDVEVLGTQHAIAPAELGGRGFRVPVLQIPRFSYQPPAELSRSRPWQPRVRVAGTPTAAHRPRIELRVDDATVETLPLTLEVRDGTLWATEAFELHGSLASGSVLNSRLLFDGGGRTYAVPAVGYRETLVSEFDAIDPGEGAEFELAGDHRSDLRRFADGRESGRHADQGGAFTYRLAVPDRANRVELEIRLAGRARIRSQEQVLHEDEGPEEARELELSLADHRLWEGGALPLTFEPMPGAAGVDVAVIRYRCTGTVADTAGLGATTKGRTPDQKLRIAVQPVSLLDRPVDVGHEALQLTMFGGAEHQLTPPPESRRTAGSVARFIEALSGGRTTLEGDVRDTAQWDVVFADLVASQQLPDSVLRLLAGAHDVDVVLAVLGSGEMPPPRSFRFGRRTVPVVFVPAREPDGSFLSCGTATAAILAARYGTLPLGRPELGNFGSLALSAAAGSHLPPGPAGIDLARTGWSDLLVLEKRDHVELAISPLSVGRTGYVLDCSEAPGRGRLLLESRRPTPADPGIGGAGLLLYWQYPARDLPYVRSRDGDGVAPAVLRVSAARNPLRSLFHPGEAADLFQTAAAELPADTLTGERLWSIRNFDPLAAEATTLDIHYLGQDLLAEPRATWTATPPGPGRDVVQQHDGRLQLTLPPRCTARLALDVAAIGLRHERERRLSRVFCRPARVLGRLAVRIGADDAVHAVANFSTGRGPTRMQADLPPCRTVWVELVNEDDTVTTCDLVQCLRVARVAPAHEIRPTRVEIAQDAWLMDGVLYGRSLRFPASGKKKSRVKTPVVLTKGHVALRIRAGLGHDAPAQASASLGLSLVNADASERRVLAEDHAIPRGSGRSGLFLGLFEIPEVAEDVVSFLEIEWSGTADLHVVDLAVVRP